MSFPRKRESSRGDTMERRREPATCREHDTCFFEHAHPSRELARQILQTPGEPATRLARYRSSPDGRNNRWCWRAPPDLSGVEIRGARSAPMSSRAPDCRERQMSYSIGWGAEIGAMGTRRNTAREALELAEEYLGAKSTRRRRHRHGVWPQSIIGRSSGTGGRRGEQRAREVLGAAAARHASPRAGHDGRRRR